MADEESPIPPLVTPPSRSQQRRLQVQRGLETSPPIPKQQAVPAGPLTRRYLVVETVNLPMGTGMTTLQQGEELSSRQYDIPRLVSLGARLQEIV